MDYLWVSSGSIGLFMITFLIEVNWTLQVFVQPSLSLERIRRLFACISVSFTRWVILYTFNVLISNTELGTLESRNSCWVDRPMNVWKIFRWFWYTGKKKELKVQYGHQKVLWSEAVFTVVKFLHRGGLGLVYSAPKNHDRRVALNSSYSVLRGTL